MEKYTPKFIDRLEPHEVFVYGSNQFGMHNAGSAKTAANLFGAKFGDAPIGLLDQSYGIITTSFSDHSVTIGFIESQVKVLYEFAKLRPDLTFYVTKIGTGIAGFSIDQIGSIFKSLLKPNNIILPKEFSND